MFRGYRSVSMLLLRSIAPKPSARHREKERGRRTKQSCPVVPSTAAYFELLISLAGETPRENAPSCDPDKRLMQRQENRVRTACNQAQSVHGSLPNPCGNVRRLECTRQNAISVPRRSWLAHRKEIAFLTEVQIMDEEGVWRRLERMALLGGRRRQTVARSGLRAV